MTGGSDFAAGALHRVELTMGVTTVYSCSHAEASVVAFSPDAVSLRHCDVPCSLSLCRQAFVRKVQSDLQLAGMGCEGSLRKFAQREPMLLSELLAAGCPADMSQALLNSANRSAAASTYLGHHSALSLLQRYELCSSQYAEANAIAMQLLIAKRTIEARTSALKEKVTLLCRNSFPAPGMGFSVAEGVRTFEPSWGRAELAALQSTAEGRSILALPLVNANILAAKSTILATAQSSSSSTQGSSQGFCSSSSSSSSTNTSRWSPLPSFSSSSSLRSAGIRSLRPARMASKHMARNRLGIDMSLINTEAAKSHAFGDAPWWVAAEAEILEMCQ